ncbi:hypothetical protein ACROYT_G032266 [Oculina patagonica]
MASHLKIVFVTFLLMFMLTEEFKPVLAKGGRLKQKVKISQKSMADLKAKMEEQETKTKEQEAKIKEQDAKMQEQEEKTKEQEAKMQEQEAKMQEQEAKTKEQEAKMEEQEEKIKTLEKCDACSKIKELNKTINELQEKGGSKTSGCQPYRYDSSSFLFSLVNKPGWQPLKLDQNGEGDNRETSIYNCDNSGPSFGGGIDISIVDHASSNAKSGASLGYTYSPPPGYHFLSSFARSFLGGSIYFQPDEVEVFYETT